MWENTAPTVGETVVLQSSYSGGKQWSYSVQRQWAYSGYDYSGPTVHDNSGPTVGYSGSTVDLQCTYSVLINEFEIFKNVN